MIMYSRAASDPLAELTMFHWSFSAAVFVGYRWANLYALPCDWLEELWDMLEEFFFEVLEEKEKRLTTTG